MKLLMRSVISMVKGNQVIFYKFIMIKKIILMIQQAKRTDHEQINHTNCLVVGHYNNII